MTEPFAALPHTLWEASASSARFAVSRFNGETPEELRQAALSVGIAAEYLLMGAVASIDPALLADKNSVPSMLALSRHNKTGRLDITSLRTVNWGQALKLLTSADPSLNIVKDFDGLMNTRNAAAHLAMYDPENLAGAAVALARVVGVLHAFYPDESEAEYWGDDLAALVDELRAERANEIELSYLAKIAAAVERYKKLVGNLDEAQRGPLVIALESRPPRRVVIGIDGVSIITLDCPACQNRGYLHRAMTRLEDYETHVDYDKDGVPEGAHVTVSVAYEAVIFECPVCDLLLDSEEVMDLPGAAPFVDEAGETLTDDEMRDYMNDWIDER